MPDEVDGLLRWDTISVPNSRYIKERILESVSGVLLALKWEAIGNR